MFPRISSALVVIFYMASQPTFAKADPLCEFLQEFVSSVSPNETREVIFNTAWGENFKDTNENTFGPQKRCTHSNYGPARALCSYLIEHGAAEFPGNNLKRTITCLSPKTTIDRELSLIDAEIHLYYGDKNSGASVQLSLKNDQTIGGTAMKIHVKGY